MRILILHQHIDESRQDELDILIQSKEVQHCLHSLGHHAVIDSIKSPADIEESVVKNNPDLVFNFIESFDGRSQYDYVPAAIFELLGVPYTGNRAKALSLTNDKRIVKLLLESKHIAVPRSLEDNDNGSTRYIVKSVTEHASFGIDSNSVVTGAVAAKALINEKSKLLGGAWFAEEYIEGREINVGMIATHQGIEILPPAEIIFENYANNQPKIIDYAAKWQLESFGYKNTVRRFIDPTEELTMIAKTCWEVFELSGYARIDLRQDRMDQYWVIDVNLNPCLSSDAGFIAAAREKGWAQQDTVNTLVQQAANKHECTIS